MFQGRKKQAKTPGNGRKHTKKQAGKQVRKRAEKNEPGRPTEFNREVVDRILEAVRKCNTLRTAAEYGGITYDTLNNWSKRGEREGQGVFFQFFQSLKKARAEAKMGHVENIEKASKKTWQASAWLLERAWPDEWGKKERHEITGAEGGPIRTQTDYGNLSDRQLKTLADLMSKAMRKQGEADTRE